MADHSFCRAFLAECRADIAKDKIKIPPLSVWMCRGGVNNYAEVFDKRNGQRLWYGTACCAWEARARAICHYEEHGVPKQ